jgi:hypothetical protein
MADLNSKLRRCPAEAYCHRVTTQLQLINILLLLLLLLYVVDAWGGGGLKKAKCFFFTVVP